MKNLNSWVYCLGRLSFCQLLIVIPMAVGSQLFAQLPNAHAHNDYIHERPLLDALTFGFTSVEADVFLVRGKLLVSHTYPAFSSRTLEQLYLTPLDSILRVNGGSIYPGYDKPFYLMIDLKSDGEPAYSALVRLLVRFPALVRTNGTPGPVVIFLSGNRPKDSILNGPSPAVALDGRPEDLGKGYSNERMPVVSDTYQNWSDWKGKEAPSSKDMERIRDLASRVHAEGKKLRLWAIPDNPAAWKALLDAGVDLINTDRLKDLSAFLRNR